MDPFVFVRNFHEKSNFDVAVRVFEPPPTKSISNSFNVLETPQSITNVGQAGGSKWVSLGLNEASASSQPDTIAKRYCPDSTGSVVRYSLACGGEV